MDHLLDIRRKIKRDPIMVERKAIKRTIISSLRKPNSRKIIGSTRSMGIRQIVSNLKNGLKKKKGTILALVCFESNIIVDIPSNT